MMKEHTAPDNAIFSNEKFWYFPYFSMKTCCGYSLEAPLWGASNEYPQHTFPWTCGEKRGIVCGYPLLPGAMEIYMYFMINSRTCILWEERKKAEDLLKDLRQFSTSQVAYATCTSLIHICFPEYSRTSMARTPLGPWKFVRDMGSSSHWGLIMAPGQEANSDNLGKSFWFSTQ